MKVSNEQIAGYYTIAATGIATPDLPPEDIKNLLRHPTLPTVRIGRLAVDQHYQGQGLGKALLAGNDRSTGVLCTPSEC